MTQVNRTNLAGLLLADEETLVVAYRGRDPEGGEGFVGAKWPDAFGEECVVDALVTLSDYTLKYSEVERLRAEQEGTDALLKTTSRNLRQQLVEAQALLRDWRKAANTSDVSTRTTSARQRIYSCIDRTDAFLSATAQPAVELMTFAQFVERAAAILDSEQERLSKEDYLMDSEDCVKVLREAIQPADGVKSDEQS